MKKKLEINLKKIMIMYMIGFTSAFLVPQGFYFKIMNFYHKQINDNIEILDKDEFYHLK
jgi:hypothetical protein